MIIIYSVFFPLQWFVVLGLLVLMLMLLVRAAFPSVFMELNLAHKLQTKIILWRLEVKVLLLACGGGEHKIILFTSWNIKDPLSKTNKTKTSENIHFRNFKKIVDVAFLRRNLVSPVDKGKCISGWFPWHMFCCLQTESVALYLRLY